MPKVSGAADTSTHSQSLAWVCAHTSTINQLHREATALKEKVNETGKFSALPHPIAHAESSIISLHYIKHYLAQICLPLWKRVAARHKAILNLPVFLGAITGSNSKSVSTDSFIRYLRSIYSNSVRRKIVSFCWEMRKIYLVKFHNCEKNCQYDRIYI